MVVGGAYFIYSYKEQFKMKKSSYRDLLYCKGYTEMHF